MTMAAVMVAAVSFLPYFETNNVVAAYVAVPPPAGAAPAVPAKPSLLSRVKCPACGGRRKIELKEQDFGQYGASGRIGRPKTVVLDCAFCGGKGRVEAYADPDAALAAIAADRAAFDAAHKAKGDLPAGYAYLPRQTWTGLDKKTLKLVAQAYGEPCGRCGWSGIEACRKCSGRGVLKCPEKNCKGGWLVEKTKTGKSRRVNVSVCPECSGAALVACPACGGRRASPCRRCGGSGEGRKKGVSP